MHVFKDWIIDNVSVFNVAAIAVLIYGFNWWFSQICERDCEAKLISLDVLILIAIVTYYRMSTRKLKKVEVVHTVFNFYPMIRKMKIDKWMGRTFDKEEMEYDYL